MSGNQPTPIIMTLDSQSVLTSPLDIMGYLLRYYMTAPKSVSNTAYPFMISIADTISKYQGNAASLGQQVTTDLTSVFNRFFPPGSSVINVSTEDNGDGTYNLTLQLSVSINGQSYALGADVSVNSAGILNLKWHPQLN